MALRIEVLVTPDCPNAGAAERLVRQTATRLAPDTEIVRTLILTGAEAEEHAFPGSPTVRVNGEDVAGPDTGPPAFACRRYEDGTGVPAEWLLEARILRALSPRHVLFLCVANSARSQMAEGIAQSMAPDGVVISSAGSAPSRVNRFAIQALEEIGIDISAQDSKSIDDIHQSAGQGVDAVFTLCAEEVCPVWLGRTRRVHWPLPDPAAMGSDEETMDSFRNVSDVLRLRLTALFEPHG